MLQVFYLITAREAVLVDYGYRSKKVQFQKNEIGHYVFFKHSFYEQSILY